MVLARVYPTLDLVEPPAGDDRTNSVLVRVSGRANRARVDRQAYTIRDWVVFANRLDHLLDWGFRVVVVIAPLHE